MIKPRRGGRGFPPCCFRQRCIDHARGSSRVPPRLMIANRFFTIRGVNEIRCCSIKPRRGGRGFPPCILRLSSYVFRLTSFVLRLSSCVLRLASYFFPNDPPKLYVCLFGSFGSPTPFSINFLSFGK